MVTTLTKGRHLLLKFEYEYGAARLLNFLQNYVKELLLTSPSLKISRLLAPSVPGVDGDDERLKICLAMASARTWMLRARVLLDTVSLKA